MTWRNVFGAEMPQLIGPDRLPAPPTNAPGSTNVVQGQKVTFELTAAGTLITSATKFYTLMRGADKAVAVWQVTLSPMFRNSVGSDEQGTIVNATGFPIVRLTWGGGGVTYRRIFFLPVAGASFCVPGEEVMVEVAATDGLNVYTAATLPAVVGWLKPVTAAERAELFHTTMAASPLAEVVPPFARYLWVGGDTPAATFLVTWTLNGGATFTVALPAGLHRIPVCELTNSVTITASAGNVYRQWEMSLS